MIGLEYILNLYNTDPSELAKEINIQKQNINNWIKGKKNIPTKHLDYFERKFNIPKQYFQRELTKVDIIKILHSKLLSEIEITKTNIFNDEEYISRFIDDSLNNVIDYRINKIDIMKKFNSILKNIKLYDCNENQRYEKEVLSTLNIFLDFIGSKKIDIQMLHRIMKAIEIVYIDNKENIKIDDFFINDLVKLFSSYKNIGMDDLEIVLTTEELDFLLNNEYKN